MGNLKGRDILALFTQRDKILHMCASFVAMVVLTAITGIAGLSFILTVAIGIGWEFYWHRKEGSPVSGMDIIANVIGVIAGFIVLAMLGVI